MNAVTYDNIWYVKREKREREFKYLIRNLLSNFIAMNFISRFYIDFKRVKIQNYRSRALRKKIKFYVNLII